MCTPEDFESGANGWVRGRVTIESRPAARVIGTVLCCEEVFRATDLGEFEIALPEGAHKLQLLDRNALPAYLDFVIQAGSVLTLAPIELIAESVVKNRGEGDLCPVHRVVLRVVTLPVDYGLPDRGHAERCARFPFAGNMAWGGCTEGPERAVEVLRCDACSVGDRELFVQARRKPD